MRGSVIRFDPEQLRLAAGEYDRLAMEVREQKDRLQECFSSLMCRGWTTDAGALFTQITTSGWEEESEQISQLCETMRELLLGCAAEYEQLEEKIRNAVQI